MSTLRVNTLQNTSTTDGGISIDTSGHVTVDGVAMPSAGPLSNRNKIINGDMRIDQRFGGTAATYGVGYAYVLDRWNGAATIGSNMRVQRVTDTPGSNNAPAGFTNSLKADAVTGATITASDYFTVLQAIEGFNVSDLGFGTASASDVTLSFWVKSSVTGTHSGSLRNSANDRSYPYTYEISSADIWEKKTIIIPGDTSGTWLTTNGVGIEVIFDLGTGSTFRTTAGAWTGAGYLGVTGAVSPLATLGATWYITGVQLEAGSVATPFERRSYGQELSLCQRYYEAQDEETYLGFPAPNATFAHTFPLMFKVQKRTVPTIVYNLNNLINVTTSTLIFTNTYAWSLQVIAASSTNTTASTNFTANAEL